MYISIRYSYFDLVPDTNDIFYQTLKVQTDDILCQLGSLFGVICRWNGVSYSKFIKNKIVQNKNWLIWAVKLLVTFVNLHLVFAP